MSDTRPGTSKSRVQRIDRFYHRRRSADRRLKSLATWSGVLDALALGAFLLSGARTRGPSPAGRWPGLTPLSKTTAPPATRGFEPIPDGACLACHERPAHHPARSSEPRCATERPPKDRNRIVLSHAFHAASRATACASTSTW